MAASIPQVAASIGWTRGEGAFWGNRAEDPGKPFTPAGYRLARVLWIHYLSKVRSAIHDCAPTAWGSSANSIHF